MYKEKLIKLIENRLKIIPHGVNRGIFHSQQLEKNEDLLLGTHLGTRNKAGVDHRQENMPVDVDNQYTADTPFIFVSNKGWRGTNWDRGGVQYLLQAFSQEFSKEERVALHIKLNPAYINPEHINQALQNLNLPEDRAPIHINCELMPFEKLPDLYRQADCYVCATRAESFDLGTAEAMSCGLPVLTSGYGGQIEHMIENKNALFFDYELEEIKEDIMYENTSWCIPKIEDIRKKMRWMFEHQKEAKQMGQNAEQFIKNNFTWDLSAKKIIDYLK